MIVSALIGRGRHLADLLRHAGGRRSTVILLEKLKNMRGIIKLGAAEDVEGIV